MQANSNQMSLKRDFCRYRYLMLLVSGRPDGDKKKTQTITYRNNSTLVKKNVIFLLIICRYCSHRTATFKIWISVHEYMKCTRKAINLCKIHFIFPLVNFKETYEERIADLEIKLEKSQEQHKQLQLQKSQAETELRKVHVVQFIPCNLCALKIVQF